MQLIGTLSLSVLLLVCLGSRDLVLEVHADQATAATPDNDSVEGKGDSIAGKKESSKIDLSKIDPSKDGVNNMTRMLLYEYMLETETTLVDERWPEKVRVTSKINASYAFEIIHYDKHGDILARYRLLKCNSGPCDYRMPDVYVDFIQGGNNIIGVFASLRDGEKATWNPLFSIVNAMNTPAISGDGDEQDVITPYGVCHYRFWRPEDKKFKRRISNCSLEGLRNHSLIQDATLHQYEQNVQYIQNMKIDADIVFVDADETFLLRSPLNDKFSIKLHSKMSLEMTKRNRTYGERICPFNETASECAQNSIGATRLGRNWKEIRQNMKLGIVRRATKTAAIMKKYRQRIMTKKSIDDALLFGELVSAVVLASKDELTEVAKEEDNQPILGIFVNALGSAGTLLTHRFAREFLSNGEAELAERYLESLALTTKINDVIIDDLKAWLAEENRSPSWKVLKEDAENSREDGLDGNNDKEMKHHKQLKKHIAFALTNLLRRRCESSTSRVHACNNGKDKPSKQPFNLLQDVNEFITHITNCSDLHCQLGALQVLMNLRTAGVVPYADQFICTNDRASQSLQKTALRLLSLVDFKFLNSSIIDRLLRIFRDTCPLPQATTDQTLATDVLLNTIPERISVGTYLLRMESLKPDNHEKWAYFYDSVAQRRLVSEKVDDYWTRMRQFRVFKANYLHRSLAASSSVIGIKFAENHNYGMQSLSKTEFNGGIFKRSDFLLSVTGRRGRHFPLFGITTDTEGLVEYLTESLTTDERSDLDKKSPEAAVQLSHFGTFLPPISVFDGYTELLSAIWNADGHTIDGHDTNVVWRQFINVIPLLSGLTLTSDIIGSTSVRLSGSSQISLWDRASSSSLITNLSASLESKLTLWSSDAITGDVVSRLSAFGSVVLNLDVDFYTEPYLFCTVVSQGPFRFRRSASYVTASENRRGLANTLTLPGRSFALNERTTRMCSEMLQHE